MAIHRVSYLALLLLFGMVLVASNVEHADAKPCPLYCDLRIKYQICADSPTEKIPVGCTNCCFAKEGCKFYSGDGTLICEGKPDVSEVDNQHPKPCPRNCDPEIAFEVSPLLGNKMINLDQICTNCCAGKKGCRYFSADGTFICEGESEYVSGRGNDILKSKVAMS